MLQDTIQYDAMPYALPVRPGQLCACRFEHTNAKGGIPPGVFYGVVYYSDSQQEGDTVYVALRWSNGRTNMMVPARLPARWVIWVGPQWDGRRPIPVWTDTPLFEESVRAMRVAVITTATQEALSAQAREAAIRKAQFQAMATNSATVKAAKAAAKAAMLKAKAAADKAKADIAKARAKAKASKAKGKGKAAPKGKAKAKPIRKAKRGGKGK